MFVLVLSTRKTGGVLHVHVSMEFLCCDCDCGLSKKMFIVCFRFSNLFEPPFPDTLFIMYEYLG